MLGAFVAMAVVLIPMGYLGVRATDRGWDGVRATLWRPRTLELVQRSVGLAATVTVLCVIVGVTGAWLVTRTDVPGRRLFAIAFAVPLSLPSYVAAFAWLGARPGLTGFRGAVIVLTTISVPYVYLPVRAALQQTDPALEEVARSLGSGPLRTFLTVTLRSVRIATISGALLVGLYVLSDFGAVSIVRYESLTHVIFRSYRGSFDRTPAAVLGVVLVVLALAVTLVASRFTRDSVAALQGTPRPHPRVELGRLRWPAFVALSAWSILSVGVPAWGLYQQHRRGTSRADLGQWFDAATTTLWVATAAAAVTLALAIPVGYLSARHDGPLARTTTAVAYAGHALPGLVVGLSLVFFGIRFAQPIYQRLPMLVAGYSVLYLSLAIGSAHQAIAAAPPVLDDVARSLGRSRASTWFTVTLPLAAPGLGAGATLVFLMVAKELPATLLLRPIGMDTLATRLWSHTGAGSYAAAVPYAITIVALAAIPAAALTRRIGR